MAQRSEFSFGHSAFDEFLHASVGEEKNGIELTVLSALTRLGVDPWAEAARLSNLPEQAAAQALATTIAGIPEGNWKLSDLKAIATRLVGRLPRRSDTSVGSPRTGGVHSKPMSAAAMWLICIVLAAVLLVAFDRYTDQVKEADPSPVSSTRR